MVAVRTLHGKFCFLNQRYLSKDRTTGSDFLGHYNYGELNKGYRSTGLCEFICYYGNQLSCREQVKLLTRMSGNRLYCASQTGNRVVEQSKRADDFFASQNAGTVSGFMSPDTDADIYGVDNEEVCYLDDAVGVVRQNAKRRDDTYVKEKETIQTDVVMIQRPESRGYEYLSRTDDADSGPDLESRILMTLSRLYKGREKLPVVAITDGAQTIRCRLNRLFGMQVKVILDWYHLQKRVREEMSRMGFGKEEKEAFIKSVLEELWTGHVFGALTYIDVMIHPLKNKDVKEDLLRYLQKHESEIINYGKRHLTGKCIGSGRGEKGNDQVTAYRQKKKGSAWSPEGSKALSTLKCLQLNGYWREFWQKAC